MVYVKQISGTHFPAFKGRLAVNGSHNGQPLYQRGMSQKWVWFDTVTGGYVISNVVGTLGDYAWSQDAPSTNPDGVYHVTGSHCEGAPVVGPITTPGEHGIIALWSGSIASIPIGWVLCDGTHGTPDLREKFIMGANASTTPPGTTGGTTSHLHDIEIGTIVTELDNGLTVGGSGPFGRYATMTFDAFDSGNADNIPPYYALAYIMHL
jgi:hypothetical protein